MKTVLSLSFAASLALAIAQPSAAQNDEQETVIVRQLLTKEDSRDPASGGPRKHHLMQMAAGNAYKIELGTPNDSLLRPCLRVEDESGKVLADAAADKDNKAELLFTPLADGAYRLVVASQNADEFGPYTLSIARGEGFGTVEFTGVLERTDPFDRVRQQCHCKVYFYKMFAGRTYTIDLEARFDAYLRIEDSNGKHLAQDDDSGAGLNARLTFRPKHNDSYRVIATSCGGGQVGPYTLKIRTNPPEKVLLQSQDQLQQDDPLDNVRRGSHHKVYTVRMEAGESYTIDLESRAFDAYLRLENAAGNNIAQNDDGGQGLNARIHFRPTQTADYRIIATTFRAGARGEFTLTVRQN